MKRFKTSKGQNFPLEFVLIFTIGLFIATATIIAFEGFEASYENVIADYQAQKTSSMMLSSLYSLESIDEESNITLRRHTGDIESVDSWKINLNQTHAEVSGGSQTNLINIEVLSGGVNGSVSPSRETTLTKINNSIYVGGEN